NQNINGWGLKVADYFIPYNEVALDNADRDFGSGAPLILPDSAGIAGHPHLLLAAGKEGKIYVLDRDNLGHFDTTNAAALNSVLNSTGNKTPPVQVGGAFGPPAYFNGTIYWSSGYASPTFAFTINPNGTLKNTSKTASKSLGSLPGPVVVSANG